LLIADCWFGNQQSAISNQQSTISNQQFSGLLVSDIVPSVPDLEVLARLGVAAAVGAIVGIDRERHGKPAGLRTHVLVSAGAALFVVAAAETGMPTADMSRVIQGVAAGVGFLGAGAILKLSDAREILGLTTAATIWMTAALGVAAGLGRLWLAAIAALLTLVTLIALGWLENRLWPGRAEDFGTNSDDAR
jgi:putative Mg2+ transporter-C (MgtC) family protein